MVVGQYRVDVALGVELFCLSAASGLEHVHAPLSEQRLHSIQDRTVVVHTQHTQAAQSDRVRRRALRSDAFQAARLDVACHSNAESRATPRATGECQRVVHQPCQAIADRQAQPKAFLAPRRRLLATAELGVHGLPQLLVDPGPGVVHDNLELTGAPAATDHYPAASGVAQCIRQIVLDDPPQQHAIAAHHFLASDDAQAQLPRLRQRRVLAPQLFQQLDDRKARNIRLEHAAVQARNVQQVVEQLFGRAHRGIDAHR